MDGRENVATFWIHLCIAVVLHWFVHIVFYTRPYMYIYICWRMRHALLLYWPMHICVYTGQGIYFGRLWPRPPSAT